VARSEENPPTLGAFALYVWRLSRPEAWMVSVLPVYLGHLVATREIFPNLSVWTTFWERAAREGAMWGEFASATRAWLALSADFLLAVVAMGPLIWAATLLINDVHDLPGDRVNPRKARSPLVQGLVSRGWAHAAAYVFAVLTLATALLVNARFALMVLACLALAWLYSVPPVRLKTRPGADLAVNALGVGLLSAVAGWVITEPFSTAPYWVAPQGLLVAAALYVPTTLVDHEADARIGYLTLATQLGPRRAYRIGFLAWVLANVGALVLSAKDLFIPHRMLPLLLIFNPLMVWQYHQFIGRAKTPQDRVWGIVLCSLTFFAVNLVFALMYTGLWV
jgi:4-hydroxybenzoate polyprenyltransferase